MPLAQLAAWNVALGVTMVGGDIPLLPLPCWFEGSPSPLPMGCRREGSLQVSLPRKHLSPFSQSPLSSGSQQTPAHVRSSRALLWVFWSFLFVCLFFLLFFYSGGWFVCFLIYICSGSRSGGIYGICGWLMGVILQAEFLRFLLEASFFSSFLCFPLPSLPSLFTVFFLAFFPFLSILREPSQLNVEFFPCNYRAFLSLKE